MVVYIDNKSGCHLGLLLLMIASFWIGSSAFQRGRVNAFFQNSCAATVPNPCQQICTDIQSGGFFCQCLEGFLINKDGMTCSEFSELPAESDSDGKTNSKDRNTENHSIAPHEKDSTKNESQSDGKTSPGHTPSSQSKEVDEVVHVHSVGLKQGLPTLQSDSYVRLKSDSGVVFDRDFYNIPEGGSHDGYSNAGFNYLDIPEGGDPTTDSEHEVQFGLSPHKKEFQQQTGRDILCEKVLCENNGTCAVMESKAVCQCPLGTFGESCKRAVEVKYPKFVGTGYLALPVQYDSHKELRVSLEFKPESPNGLLIFSSEFSDVCTHFFSVVLDDGFVVYRFGCGTDIAVLKSSIRVTLATRNKLVVTRLDTTGSLQLNADQQVEGRYQGEHKRAPSLNVYLGGYSDIAAIFTYVATPHSFVGCIQEFTVNRHTIDFRKKALAGELKIGINVGECSEHVCDGVSCLNGGTCTVKSSDQHVCLCPLGFHGDTCHEDSPVHIPYFSGHSYLEFPGLERSVLSYTEIVIVFKPTSGDGTLLYNGYSKDNGGDFISLSLQDGHLEFRFDLGTVLNYLKSR